MFQCHDPIFFDNSADSKMNSTVKPKNVNVLIITPSTESFASSNMIQKNYHQKFNNHQNIKMLRLDAELSNVGITPYTANSIDKLNFNLLNPLLQKYKITHLIVFEIKNDDNNLQAIPKLFDAFTKSEVPSTLKPFLVKQTQLSYTDVFLDKFHIIPNSVSITRSKFESDDKALRNEKHPEALPSFVTFFSAGNVYTPHLYNPWDYDFFTTTNFSLPSWKTTISQKDYLFQGVTGTFNGGVLLKTPLGAFSLSMGIGGIYF